MGLGKWIAGVLGWAMFGPIGGILGFWFGSKLENAEAGAGSDGDRAWNQGQRNSFLMSLLVLSAQLSKLTARLHRQSFQNSGNSLRQTLALRRLTRQKE